MDAGMAHEPTLHGRRAVRGEIVEHDVDVEGGFDTCVNVSQERDKVLRAMLGCTSCQHFAGGDVEGGEQVERAVPQVVVGATLGLAEIHRQNRLRALKRLDLDFSSTENTTAFAGGAM